MYESYNTEAFEAKFTYPGTDLGATWSPEQTCFRLWAPTAEEVRLRLYTSGDPECEDLMCQVNMDPGANGTWFVALPGNLHGTYYTYLVLVDTQFVECCDPYAKAVGINGFRAMVIDLDSTNPPGWESDTDPHVGASITDAVIYELHIRDFSCHRSAHFVNKGKFLALTEPSTPTKGGRATGLAHIQQLGVTHVHLLPVFDFGFTDEYHHSPQYNWGYDPVNFNVPEGSYATDPADGSVRITQMKQMVKSLHDAGLSVIMDVVYNHVYDGEDFCFNRIVPGYFSRISPDGVYSNGSFCGNDTASERSMVRKYIVDSLCYWANEYHIDGFRFDLVGLLDIPTMQAAMTAVHKMRPSVLFYGEGWTMPTVPTRPNVALAVQGNSAQLPGFAFFSDTMRNLLRGSNFSDTALGYASGAVCSKEDLEASFMGVPPWAAQPCQCVNYVSCHDNHTLFDRLALSAPEAPRETLIAMNRLAAAFSMLSQGVPFFQAGEELLRTKPGQKELFDGNSYRSGDKVNALRWDDLDKPEYAQTSDYYQGLIAFRKAHPALRLTTRDQVRRQIHPQRCDNPHTVAFLIDEAPYELFLAFNADTQTVSLPLPQGPWHVYIRQNQAGTTDLGTVYDQLEIPPFCAMALCRRKPIDVVAALLWERDKFLICQRPAGKSRGMLWEFPGGRVEPGETLQQGLARECSEALAVTMQVGNPFMQIMHEYPDLLIRLTLFQCILDTGIPQALEHHAIRWVHPSWAEEYPFCPADARLLKEVKRVYGKNPPL